MDENKNANELNEALKGMWDSLTDEQREKAKACKTMDELTLLAGGMGVELPDELLDAVAGGSHPLKKKDGSRCPYCGKTAQPSSAQSFTEKMIKGDRAVKFYCAKGNHGYFYVPRTGCYYDNNDNEITPVTTGIC